jgi:hypothetical protein
LIPLLMRRALSILMFAFLLNRSFGQSGSIHWNSGNLSLGIQPSGALFQKDGSPASSTTAEDTKHFLSGSFTWVYAEAGSDVYGALGTDTTKEWWPGPIDTFLLTAKNPEDWSSVWSVSKSEVLNHRMNYSKTNYETPVGIANWPANVEEQGVPKVLAPFVDADENGIYEPDLGDYPFLLGDWNAYTIANDVHGEHPISGAQKMGLEVRCMLFSVRNDDLENVVFVRWYIINRSEETYDRVHFGQMLHMELGNAEDNFVRTNVNKNAVMGYNGDSKDEQGFDPLLPSTFFAFLNRGISSSAVFMDGDGIRRMPQNATEFSEVMNGNWPDGSRKYLEGDGTSGINTTKFAFPGVTGENANVNSTEENAAQLPGKRIVLAIAEVPAELAPGAFITLDAAYGFVLSQDPGLGETERLLDETISYHKSVLNESSLAIPSSTAYYPNPIQSGQVLEFKPEVDAAIMYTLDGKIACSLQRVTGEISIKRNISLKPGIYLVESSVGHFVKRTRLVIL